MFYTLDRFEGNYAILLDDNKKVFPVKKELLLENAQTGNVFKSHDGLTFEFLKEETLNRKNEAKSLHKSLFNKAKNNK